MNDELSKLIAEIEDVTKSVEATFGDLNSKQLNWKPNAKSWSIGQCLEHLIITNEKEFPAIEDALKENYKNPFWSKIPLLPKFFGSLLVYLFKPENTRKLKAPKVFSLRRAGVSENIVADFAAHQQKFARLIEESKRLDVKKTNIVSSVTVFITYNLFDSFLHLVVHERRHLNQAERVMQIQGFPH